MPRSRDIIFILEDGTDVFVEAEKDGFYHIRYIMPNGLPNVVLWSKEGENESFFDSNAIEAIDKLTTRLSG